MHHLLFLALTSVKAPDDAPRITGSPDDIQHVLTILFNFIGAIALLIIVVSGFRYITSAGDPQKAGTARSGIIYALVGLVIAISAQAIMAFVIARIK